VLSIFFFFLFPPVSSSDLDIVAAKANAGFIHLSSTEVKEIRTVHSTVTFGYPTLTLVPNLLRSFSVRYAKVPARNSVLFFFFLTLSPLHLIFGGLPLNLCLFWVKDFSFGVFFSFPDAIEIFQLNESSSVGVLVHSSPLFLHAGVHSISSIQVCREEKRRNDAPSKRQSHTHASSFVLFAASASSSNSTADHQPPNCKRNVHSSQLHLLHQRWLVDWATTRKPKCDQRSVLLQSRVGEVGEAPGKRIWVFRSRWT
jgi:hypothetical protein